MRDFFCVLSSGKMFNSTLIRCSKVIAMIHMAQFFFSIFITRFIQLDKKFVWQTCLDRYLSKSEFVKIQRRTFSWKKPQHRKYFSISKKSVVDLTQIIWKIDIWNDRLKYDQWFESSIWVNYDKLGIKYLICLFLARK